MKTNTQIFALFLSLSLISSCNGQIKQEVKVETISEKKTELPKIKGTQGASRGNILCNLVDKHGNIWFSTSGEGVYRYDGKSFVNFTTQDGLSSNNVCAIIEDKAGNILFGTQSGICQFDGKHFSPFTDVSDASKKPISSLIQDSKGNLWFGVWNGGIFRYDGTTFTNFLNNKTSEKSIPLFNQKDPSFNLGNKDQLILDMLEDKTGNIWFSSWNGGGVWQFDGTSFTNHLPSPVYYERNEDGRSGNIVTEPIGPILDVNSSDENITDDMIYSITQDKAGHLWFATRRHGACLYDGKTFTSFRENQYFVSYGIHSILEDAKGKMWFTTDKNGVYSYDGSRFKNYTTKDGLINNSVFSILEDKNGYLWFGTRDFGLSRFDGREFVNFSE